MILQEILSKQVNKLKEDKNLVSLVQVGSSMREDFDFIQGLSDIDLMIIKKHYKTNPRRGDLKTEFDGDMQIDLIYRNKYKYMDNLDGGVPVDIIALNHGKVLHDDGFFANINKSKFGPTPHTTEVWMRTASCNFSTLLREYISPSCAHCFMTALYHSSRDFLRVILLKKTNKILEGKEVEQEAKKHYPALHENYKAILDARKDWREFEDEYDVFAKRKVIGRDEKAKLILSSEAIARKAYKSYKFKPSNNIEMPKIKQLLSELNKKYRIDHFMAIVLDYDNCGYYFSMELKDKKFIGISYYFDGQEWGRARSFSLGGK